MKHLQRFLLLVLLALLGPATTLLAVPASNDPFAFFQPDGTEITLRLRGDEWFHWYETLEGRPVSLDPASAYWTYSLPNGLVTTTSSGLRVGLDEPTTPLWQPARPAAGPKIAPDAGAVVHRRTANTSGTGLIPVLLGNFSNTTPTVSASTLSNLLFASGPGVRSMSTYFSEVSYGQFTVAAGPSGVQNWVTVPNPASFYATNAGNQPNLGKPAARFVRDTVLAAIAAGYNFAPYAQYDPAKVDVVNIVHAGRGQESGGGPGTIWSHRSSLSDQGLAPITNGTVVIDDYVIQPELASDNGATTVGVFVHEHGHALGLPDLYDTTYTTKGVGDWSGMSYGENNRTLRGGDCPAHFDAWCKAKLGWISPVDYTLNFQNVPFPFAASNSFAARLWKDGLAGREYYLVENRYKAGFDSGLPASGLLIWHIDDSKAGNTQTWYPITPNGSPAVTGKGNPLVALVQADNLWQLNMTNSNNALPVQFTQNSGDAGDPFPGSATNRLFGPNTTPNSFSYNVGSTPGYNSFVTVSNISDAGLVMTADLYTRSPNSGPLVDWVNLAGLVPPSADAQFSRLDAQHPVVIRAFPGATGNALSQAQLYITRALDGRWWNFTSQQWETNATSSNYNMDASQKNGLTLAFLTGLPGGTNLVNGDHTFIMRVLNSAGVVTEIQMAMTAARAPEVSLSLADNSVLNTLTNFSALAVEESGLGIQRVEVSLYYESGASEGAEPVRWFWSGTSWSPTPLWLGVDFPTHPAQATLFYPIGPDAPDLLTEKQYVITARAVDGFGTAATNTISVYYDPGASATIYWRYAAGGNWFDPANWNPSRVPTSTDHAVVNTPGDYTVNINAGVSVASLRFGRVVGLDRQRLNLAAGATLTVSGTNRSKIYGRATLNQAGSIAADSLRFSPGAIWNWSQGSLSGGFELTSGALWTISGNADHDLPNTSVTNSGTTIWTGGRLRGGSGGTRLFNLGVWDCQVNSVINSDYGGNGVAIQNRGTFRKSAAADTAILGGVAFENFGTIEVQTNTLSFNSGGVFQSGSRFTGAGSTLLAAGAFTLNGTIASSNLVQVGGTLGGSHTLTGVFAWNAGDWNTAGATTIATNGLLKIQTGADHDFAHHTLTNLGTVLWTGGRIRGGGSGTRIVNLALWDCQVNSSLNSDFGGNGVYFQNRGQFRKSAGEDTAIQPGVAFENLGVVDVQTSTLTFNSGGLFQHGSRFIGAGTNILAAGTFTLDGTVTSSNLVQIGGTLAGTNLLSGVYVWNSGDWNSTGLTTIGVGALLKIQSGADHNLAHHTLTNLGTVLWTGGRIRGGGNGTTIFNAGLWESRVDSEINADYGGNAVAFNNSGTYFKSSTSGTTTFTGGVTLNNTGVVEVQTGTLVISGGGVNNGAFKTSLNGGLSLNSDYNLTTTSSFTGPGATLVAGTLTGTWRGPLTWLSGVLGGTVVIPTNATLHIAGSGDHNLPNCTLTNFGLVNWVGGRVRGGANGTVIHNYGVWDDQIDSALNADYGGNGVLFNNFAIFRKSTGTNTTTITGGVVLNNSGTVEVQAGTLTLNGGGVNSGAFSTAANTVLNFNSPFTLNAGSSLLGTGAIMVGGTISGTWNGLLSWQAGSLIGTVLLPVNSTLNIIGAGDHDFPNFTMTNFGTVAWLGGRVRGGGNGTRIHNQGVWDARVDSQFNADFGGNGVIFDNFATLRKTAGDGDTTLGAGVSFLNSGTLEVRTGTVTLGGGGVSAGVFQTAPATTLNLNSSFALNPGTMFIGAGARFTAGTLTGTWTGALDWVGGNLVGTLLLPTAGRLNIVGGADHDMANCVLTNLGTVAWSGGRIRGGGNGTILVNGGLWDASADTQINADFGGNGVTFRNSGTFRKSAGAGTTALNPGVTIHNTGVMDAQAGAIALNGAYFLGGGTLAVGLSSASAYGRLNLGGNAQLDGAFSLYSLNGYLPAPGTVFTPVSFGASSGLFSGVSFPGALIETNYSATTFSITYVSPDGTATRPTLQLANSGGQLRFTWPVATSGGGFALETSASVSPGAVWVPVTNGVITVGDQFSFTITTNKPSAFYRLRK